LLTVLSRRPWRQPEVARTLGATHARLHAFELGEDLPTVHDYLGACIDDPAIPDELRRPARRRLGSMRAGNNLCHWDFHPANLLQGQNGPVVIDWTFALLFRPDIVKIGLDSEAVALLREESQPGEASSPVIPEVDRHQQDARPREAIETPNQPRDTSTRR